jgi:hypothetical integral membrane protein (TIGR02206 family)
MGVLACLTLAAPAVEFVYFAGLTGAGMVLLTPDFGSPWPADFFMNHGAVIVTAVTLVYGEIATLRREAMWRAYGWLLVYGVFAGLWDWIFHANYGFLRRKPGLVSLVAILGPWPVYIVSCLLIGLGIFRLLALPLPVEASPVSPSNNPLVAVPSATRH